MASVAAQSGFHRRLSAEMWTIVPIALPLVLAFVGQLAIGTTDMLMLGWRGPESLAATSLALSLFNPLWLLGSGIGTAITPLAASAIAGRQLRLMRRTVRQGIWAILPFSALVLPIFWHAEALFIWVGQKPALAAGAQAYLHGVSLGVPGILLFNALRSYVTALQRTRIVLFVTIAAVPLNALLGYGLIFGAFGLPEWGIFGAGIAAAIVQWAMAITIAVFVANARPFRRHAIFGRFWRPDWVVFWHIHRIGIPIGLTILLEVSVFGGSAQIMGLIGTYELAAHQIALQAASITFMVPLGLGQAAVARVGQARGRRDSAGVAIAGWASMALAALFMSGSALLFWTLPGLVVGPFLDESAAAPVVLGLASSYLAIAAAFQLVDGLQVTAAHALRGLQDTRVPMWIAGFGFWGIAFPVGYLLAMHTPLQGQGVWMGLALGLLVVALLLIRRFHRLTSA